jgi:pimeloyl-ACP methyl ester carboxylesterase
MVVPRPDAPASRLPRRTIMTSTPVPAAVRIDFDDLGSGEPALLFLPGWCGDRTVFDPLSARTRGSARTLAADWRGHGRSQRPDEDFGANDLVADALRVLEQTGVRSAVPVALSHAGWIAIELRRRLGPDRVPGIVLLDWMPLGAPEPFLGALQGLQDPRAWREVRAGLFGMWTAGLDIPALTDYVESMGEYGYDLWSRGGREIAAAFAREAAPVGALERLPEPCPTLHVYSQPEDPGLLAAQEAFAADHPWFQVRRLAARSHFPMFEVPDEVAAEILAFRAGLPAAES